jgi:hypothetical protein
VLYSTRGERARKPVIERFILDEHVSSKGFELAIVNVTHRDLYGLGTPPPKRKCATGEANSGWENGLTK